MDVVIYPFNGSIAVITPAPGATTPELINAVPAGSPYAVVDYTEIPFQNNGYRSAWTYDFAAPSSSVSVDLATSKTIFQEQKDIAADRETQPLTQEYVIAVAGGQPTGTIEAEVNAIQVARTNTDYLAATDINDLTSYWPAELGKNPFVPPTSGIIATGRAPSGPFEFDMNPSTMVKWNSTIDVSDTYLFFPATGQAAQYVPGEFNYDQTGSCFTLGNYITQLRQLSTDFVLAEWECPATGLAVNVEIGFSF